jgi:hypothetical protein
MDEIRLPSHVIEALERRWSAKFADQRDKMPLADRWDGSHARSSQRSRVVEEPATPA